jgi:hypothetical protein
MSTSHLPLVPVPWAIRLVMSAALIAWGARSDARWTVPIAVGWSIPALYVDSYLPIWLGAIRLWSEGRAIPRLVAQAGTSPA